MKKLLSIEGMSCGHCVAHVTTALQGVQGVTSVQVDLANKNAEVEGDALDDALLKAAVDDVGYSVVAISS
ncbi:MAG: heavy-metal-associated domain-containing protein [Acidobacteriota bacterium]